MEYRPHTILGLVRILVILVGNWSVRTAIAGLENVLAPDLYPDPLRFLRPLGTYGWFLIPIPFAWMILSILGERSRCWWASKRTTILSGLVVLALLAAFFTWSVCSAWFIHSKVV